jgi:hypothetical protein
VSGFASESPSGINRNLQMKSVEEESLRDAAVPAASSAILMPEGIERNLVDIVASMALATALESVR